jgi:hypothetical protein
MKKQNLQIAEIAKKCHFLHGYNQDSIAGIIKNTNLPQQFCIHLQVAMDLGGLHADSK